MIKIGLVGAGFMGGMHANCYEALKETGGFKVVAVADANREQAQKLAAMFGAQVFSSAEDMMRHGDVNTVDICLPTFLHKETALTAMDLGYHVFIEKPVCLNREEAEQLLHKQKETKAKIMVGQCIRFWPEYQKLAQWVRDQTYGRMLSGVFRRLSPRPEWGWQQWLHDEARSGSAVLDLHIHDVDFVRSLLGNPLSTHSSIVRRDHANVHIHSLYHYEDCEIVLEGGWDFPSSFPFEMAYTVHFEHAVASFSSRSTPSLLVYEADGTILTPEEEYDPKLAGGQSGGNISSLGGYYNELRYFLERLGKGQEIEIATLADGCQSLDLLLSTVEAVKLP